MSSSCSASELASAFETQRTAVGPQNHQCQSAFTGRNKMSHQNPAVSAMGPFPVYTGSFALSVHSSGCQKSGTSVADFRRTHTYFQSVS
eukprot:2876859-Amphidinium_carterae.1